MMGMSMSKSVVPLLVLVFLTASCIMVANPVLSSAVVIEDSWAPKAPLHQGRAGLGVVAVNGKIYAIGGTTSSTSSAFAGGFVGTNEKYDIETDTWTYRASMPTPRAYFAVAAYQNKIYCIGGAVGINVDEIGFYSYNTSGINEVYDTVTNAWETKTTMPYAELGLQANVVNGKIYVVGGAFTYVYDIEKDAWAIKKQVPASHPWSVVVDNRLVVTGEFSTGLGSSEQKILIYDVETDNWNEGASSPTAVVEGAAGATTGARVPQRVYVLGLAVNQHPTPSTNQVYDPKTDSWATATPMPTNRTYFGVAVINDTLYAIGGHLYPSGEITGVNERYYPIGYGVPPEIKIASPENKTYNSSSVSLVFTMNKPSNWTGYSLNGQDNVTIAGNTTLSELPNGTHNLTVYATDEFGGTGTSETVYFNVDVPEPFPTAPVAAGAVTLTVVGVGLLVYFKKRRR
jgi:N-acetylneuraminic acid mutarotase